MQFILSWKNMPEFCQRTRKEYRQARWQVGLKPYRHWQVWVALLVTSALILLGLELLLPVMDSAVVAGWGYALLLLVAAVLIAVTGLVYRPAYLIALRPYLSQVAYDPASSWWKAFARSATLSVVPVVLVLLGMFMVDWGINYYDEELDPRVPAIMAWPEPIPDAENGAIASFGLMGPVDATPIETGRAYVAAHNKAVIEHTEEKPKPDALNFVSYVEPSTVRDEVMPKGKKSKGAKPTFGDVFCKADKQHCWKKLRNEPKNVSQWLSANKILLARYESLKKYPRWQNALLVRYDSSFPSYQQLIRGQALLHATAMRDVQTGRIDQGLQLIGEDIVFCRRMLAGKVTLIGKMIASAMLYKDLSLIVETQKEFPTLARQHLSELKKMVDPLTVDELSLAGVLKFELQVHLSIFEDDIAGRVFAFNDDGTGQSKSNYFFDSWARHHLKKNATRNMFIQDADRRDDIFRVIDVSATKPISMADTPDKSLRNSNVYFNQVGVFLRIVGQPVYNEYANRLFDLNALNNLIRLNLALTEKGVKAKEVPEFLGSSDRSLWNPETAKPFEWDAQRKQVYFVPATDFVKKNDNIGGVKGRVGLQVN